MRRLCLPLLCLLLCTLFTAPAAQAAVTPSRGPCTVGTKAPRCAVWRATVPYQANDGDTIDVRLDGARPRPLTRVRIAGIQAMELTDYGANRQGECKAVEAARRLDALLDAGGRRVRLAAVDETSNSRRRVVRSVAVKIGRHWFDVGTTLLGEGLALWMPSRSEWAWNWSYSRLSRAASLTELGLWAPQACGAGPFDGVPLKVWVSPQPGRPGGDPLEESITVRNEDPATAVDISGWAVRDSSLARYVFPTPTVLAPGAHVTVHVGSGTDTETDRYWKLRKAIFNNPATGERQLGDGGFLVDPHGNIRASMIYPCRMRCGDRHQGDLELKAKPRGQEYVTITNVSAGDVDLFGYRLYDKPFSYAFPAGTVLAPGASLRIDVKGDPAEDTAERKSWGLDRFIMANGGDHIDVRTFDDIVIACDAWGTGSCGG